MKTIKFPPVSGGYRYLGFYRYPCHWFKLRKLLKSYIAKSFLILDAGCGEKAGHLTAITADMQGIGLDIRRANVEKSARLCKSLGLGNLSFLVGDIENLPFRQNIFNVITCQDVLEHMMNKENAIKSIALSLKYNGILLASTSNAFNPFFFIDEFFPKTISSTILRILKVSGHYERHGRLNPWKLKSLIARNGLKVKELSMVAICARDVSYGEKVPIILYFWMIFNRLTDVTFFKWFKEVMLIAAQK